MGALWEGFASGLVVVWGWCRVVQGWCRGRSSIGAEKSCMLFKLHCESRLKQPMGPNVLDLLLSFLLVLGANKASRKSINDQAVLDIPHHNTRNPLFVILF